jgi:hypothetical protein
VVAMWPSSPAAPRVPRPEGAPVALETHPGSLALETHPGSLRDPPYLYNASVTLIYGGGSGYFAYTSISKNYYIQSFLEVPTDILNHFWVQVAVSEVKRSLRNSQMV